MDEEIEETISHDDSTPSILQQAEKEGWKAGYYNFGKVDNAGIDWFNPSILQRGEEVWMLVRGSEPHPQGFRFGQNSIWAFELDTEGKNPKRGIRLRWDAMGNVDPDQHFEDPRGFYNPNINQTIIGACTFIWYPNGRWTGAHQCIGSFDDNWQCSKFDYPRIGGGTGQMEMITDRAKYEKNWLPFLHDNHLHILYKANPWMVVGYGQTWNDVEHWKLEGVKWAFGDVRGGTSPVQVGDHYFTFPHSSLPWRGRYRRYYAGAMAFEAKPPFRPISITPEPILRGSQNDPWAQKKPLVVFPCGAIYRDGTWLISCGVNDMKAAWVEIPHEDILRRMVPINKSGASVFPATGLSESEVKALTAVPVLAEKTDGDKSGVETAAPLNHRPQVEVRESTNAQGSTTIPASLSKAHDSRGGSQKTLSGVSRLVNDAEEGVSSDCIKGDIPAQKLSGEALKQKQRENAAKARAARAAKRGLTGSTGMGGGEKIVGRSGWCGAPTLQKKRRKRLRKKRTAQEKREALEKFEAEKNLVSG